jgi:RNA polymerase sigma factor (TIGR02999 family)
MSGPDPDAPTDITRLLLEASHGNRTAFDRLLPLIYDELRHLARAKLRVERDGHTLNTTALVHEAYLRLVDQRRVEWTGRHHFFAVASEAMRRILIDHARRWHARKRGGAAAHLPLEAADGEALSFAMPDDDAADLIALDDALTRLAGFNPQGARVVQFRFFGGLSNPEVAEVLGTSERTVRRAWMTAKAWLARELSGALPPGRRSVLDLPPGEGN